MVALKEPAKIWNVQKPVQINIKNVTHMTPLAKRLQSVSCNNNIISHFGMLNSHCLVWDIWNMLNGKCFDKSDSN